jgi:hypothetical protein
MSFERTWSGDWHGRILERVRQCGFNTANANDRVGVPLLTLAHDLGPDDIAAAQLQSVLLDEAQRTNTVPRLLRDLLVRELHYRLPEGWTNPLDDRTRYEVVAAIAAWWAEFRDHLDAEGKAAARRALLEMDLPVGWLPEGPNDPVIVAFVDRCLGRQPS